MSYLPYDGVYPLDDDVGPSSFASTSTSLPLFLPLNPRADVVPAYSPQQPRFWSSPIAAAAVGSNPAPVFQPNASGPFEFALGGAAPSTLLRNGSDLAGMVLTLEELDRRERQQQALVPCSFFFSPQGCLNENQCHFSHSDSHNRHDQPTSADEVEEYRPLPLASRKRTVSAAELDYSETRKREKEAKLENKAALLRQKLREAKAARLGTPPASQASPAPSPTRQALPPPPPLPSASSSSLPLPPHQHSELASLLSILASTHSLLSRPPKPSSPPFSLHFISPLTEELYYTRSLIDRELGRAHRWGVVVEKGERVKSELDRRRRRREGSEEAEAVERRARSKLEEALDAEQGPERDAQDAVAEGEDLRCALRVLGVLARGEREVVVEDAAEGGGSGSQIIRSTFTSARTPPTKRAWTEVELVALKKMEAELHWTPRPVVSIPPTLSYQVASNGGGESGVGGVEEPKLALPSRAEGGGW